MIPHWPTSFDFEGTEVKVIYLQEDNKPYYNATTVAQALGLKNASNSALSAVDALVERVKRYCELLGKEFVEGQKVHVINSVKPARVLASDGTITIVEVAKSNRPTAHCYYYYNQEALFEILLNSNAEGALKFRCWVTHEVLPAIAKYGEYIGVRKDGIDLRRCLTDSIKRSIEAKELDEKAYATLTDVVYFIRFGVHTDTLRIMLGVKPDGNIREAISQDELRILGELETKVAGYIDLGMPISDIANNPRLINLYRRKI